MQVSKKEFNFNLLYCVSWPGLTWLCRMSFTGTNLQTLQDKESVLKIENDSRGGISSVLGDSYINSDDNEKEIYFDANILYGWAMSQSLPYDEIKFDIYVKLEDLLNTSDDSDMEYFIEYDLSYPDNKKII